MLRVGLIRAQSRQQARLTICGRRAIEEWLGQAQERRLGADFEQGINALGLQGGKAGPKTDRLAHMAHPVICCGDLGPSQLAGEVGDERQLRGVIGNALGNCAEGGQHRLHQR